MQPCFAFKWLALSTHTGNHDQIMSTPQVTTHEGEFLEKLHLGYNNLFDSHAQLL